MGRVDEPALVSQRHHELTAADGTTLYVADYLLPRAQARGSVVVMHGLGEHSGRYRHIAQFFNECGLSVRTYDHRGHGRSSGARGDVIHGDPMVQDAEIVLDDFAASFDAPPFLFGHSMGGLFACRFALSRLSPLSGLILSSPALSVRLSGLEMTMLNTLDRFLPWLGVPNGLKVDKLSHRSDVVAAYKADPLVHGKISARLLRSMLGSIDYCQSHAAQLTVPALIVAAGDDHLVDAEGSKRFHASAPASLCELRMYPGLYHEIFNENGAEAPFEDVRQWLLPRLPAA
ncbi:alpha/beta hydrolase [Massilia arenosa]|uniref:Alpha/beta hydrolase n=1 Tax=Zemynaea arenosa TaxID=2561931 RepID=A0A4Y9S7Z2_9BURK|nr:alpha/beta hydrolase [Massilia arenosa]TFW17772.1 alpha/beta hydrolase [Massilia arenosa]